MPPRNPYYLNDDLHYYWLMHLLPAAEHRAIGAALTIEQLLLVNAFWSGLMFVGFFYFFVRHFVERPWVASLACVGVLFCSSFGGIQQIWSLWQRGRSLEALRYLNIDAISRWIYQSLPIDGLHRLRPRNGTRRVKTQQGRRARPGRRESPRAWTRSPRSSVLAGPPWLHALSSPVAEPPLVARQPRCTID